MSELLQYRLKLAAVQSTHPPKTTKKRVSCTRPHPTHTRIPYPTPVPGLGLYGTVGLILVYHTGTACCSMGIFARQVEDLRLLVDLDWLEAAAPRFFPGRTVLGSVPLSELNVLNQTCACGRDRTTSDVLSAVQRKERNWARFWGQPLGSAAPT